MRESTVGVTEGETETGVKNWPEESGDDELDEVQFKMARNV